MRYPGVTNVEIYKEGVLVGYRWFDARRLTPAFPFGFGLSYTRATAAGELGRRSHRSTSPPVTEPPLRLAAFRSVDLPARGSARVTVVLLLRALQYWDANTRRWRTLPGCLTVRAGVSSRDLRLRGTVCPGA
jgi:beta-glucosidase